MTPHCTEYSPRFISGSRTLDDVFATSFFASFLAHPLVVPVCSPNGQSGRLRVHPREVSPNDCSFARLVLHALPFCVVPDAPVRPQLNVGDQRVSVAFNAPYDGGDEITAYSVEASVHAVRGLTATVMTSLLCVFVDRGRTEDVSRIAGFAPGLSWSSLEFSGVLLPRFTIAYILKQI